MTWLAEWSLKDLLSESEDADSVVQCAREMHERLENYRLHSCSKRWNRDLELATISAEFEAISTDSFPDVSDFNAVLDDLYDWADRERVWIGGEKAVASREDG